MIASDNAIGNGIIEGLTLFFVDMSDPKPVIQEAAQAYLVENNKECVITNGHEITDGFWEFRYRCNP